MPFKMTFSSWALELLLQLIVAVPCHNEDDDYDNIGSSSAGEDDNTATAGVGPGGGAGVAGSAVGAALTWK
ncbi:unnamed protein product [Enterobius vermicularis]|uniref:Secreted protein n=1 Tax=Enterobius vermicularis TaxID=51028 RepID=A0A0N4VHG1_ENTVE|nr:unnamed protein product [Enterobius vermicularis]